MDKQHIQRLQVRHPNVINEIQMEKKVLNQLVHPNVIRMYQTFQVRDLVLDIFLLDVDLR